MDSSHASRTPAVAHPLSLNGVGAAMSAASDGVFPQVFGRYVLLAPIAAGGMAEVFLADMVGPLGFRRRVALKRIHRHLANEAAFIRSFIDEARVGAQLRHPNIVTTRDLQLVDGQPCLEMDYVEGGHLGMVIHRAQVRRLHLPYAFILELARQLARGLAFAHAVCDARGRPLQLIHRDIKPSNLLLGFDGVLRLVDFGIARASNNLSHTHPDTVKGSLAYMSPEQARAERMLSPATDLFSVGAVLFELLTRQRLYPMDGVGSLLAWAARGPSDDRLKLLTALPEEQQPLVAVVKQLLTVEVSARTASAATLRAQLEALPGNPAGPEEQSRWAREWLEAVRLPIVPDLPEGSDAQAGLHLEAVLSRSLTPTQALEAAQLAQVLNPPVPNGGGVKVAEPVAVSDPGSGGGSEPVAASEPAGVEAVVTSHGREDASSVEFAAQGVSLAAALAPVTQERCPELMPAEPAALPRQASTRPSGESLEAVLGRTKGQPPSTQPPARGPQGVVVRLRPVLSPLALSLVAVLALTLLQRSPDSQPHAGAWLYVLGAADTIVWSGSERLGSPPLKVRAKQAGSVLGLELAGQRRELSLLPSEQEGRLVWVQPEGVQVFPISAELRQRLEEGP